MLVWTFLKFADLRWPALAIYQFRPKRFYHVDSVSVSVECWARLVQLTMHVMYCKQSLLSRLSRGTEARLFVADSEGRYRTQAVS